MFTTENIKNICVAISSIIIPIIVAFIGHGYTKALKDQEIHGRFVELAIEILRTEPKTHSENLRKWATEVIDNYSGVPLSKPAKNELIKKEQLPTYLKSNAWPLVLTDIPLNSVNKMILECFDLENTMYIRKINQNNNKVILVAGFKTKESAAKTKILVDNFLDTNK